MLAIFAVEFELAVFADFLLLKLADTASHSDNDILYLFTIVY